MLTSIGLVMLIAPLLAPAVGVALLNLAGWQSIFFMLAGYGMMLMLLVRFPLPTVPRRQDNETLWHRLFNAYGRVLRNRPAMGFILANALAFSALFVFITDAAFLYMDYFGISPDRFPLYFGANVVTMLGLNRLNVVLLRRYASADIMRAGLILQALAGVALLVLTLTDKLVLWAVVPLIMVTAGMVALVIPKGIASFLSLFDRDSGAATGLNGTLQFLLAGLIGSSIAASVVGSFEDQLAKAAILAAFIPVTMSMAGNAGLQASAVAVQGLATGTLWSGEIGYRLLKELLAAFFNGTVAGCILAGLTMIASQVIPIEAPAHLALATSLALLCVTTIAAMVGATIPILLDKCGIDPAMATGVFITSSNDVLGVLVFFLMATTFYLS